MSDDIERGRQYLRVIEIELNHAVAAWPKFNTAHEGWAILLEEVDELWDEVKKNPRKHRDRTDRMRKEAIQVAAMALRFLLDCCPEEE